MENDFNKKRQARSTIMGTAPIGKLLLKMSIPAMFSMLVQALYNIVDSIFVGKLEYGKSALTALALAFPLQLLTTAFATGLAVGTMSLIARRLGEGKQEEASEVAKTGIFLAFINAAIFLLIGIFFSQKYISLFTTDPEIIKLGTQYLSIVLIFSAGAFIDIMLGRILQGTGNMKVPMVSQIIGSVTNIILNPIFIFGLLFVPKLGVSGSAIATVIGQFMSMIFDLYIFKTRKQDVEISLKEFRPKYKNVIEIYKIGLPIIAMQALIPVTTTFMNGIITVYSVTAVAVLGIFFKLQSFLLMPIIGLSQGGLPVLAFNFGAGNKNRFYQCMKYLIISSTTLMIIGLAAFNLFPRQLLSLFSATEEMISMGTVILSRISLSFIFVGVNFILAISFQSIGKSLNAFIMSCSKQLIILVPLAWFLGKSLGFDSVWYAYFVAEFISFLIFAPVAYFTLKKSFGAKVASVK